MSGVTAWIRIWRQGAIAASALSTALGSAGAEPRTAASAAIRAQLDAALDAQMQRCWDGSAQPVVGYLPQVVVRYDGTGHVAGQPTLLNLPVGPDQRLAAASAIRAVRACDPVHLPQAAKGRDPEGWRRRQFRFDPEMGFVTVAPIGAGPEVRDRLPPAVRMRLDAILGHQLQGCYAYQGRPVDYVPELVVTYHRDGSMDGQPALLNLPVGPEQAGLAASALAALRDCNPLRIPQDLVRYYDEGWRRRVVRFDTVEKEIPAPPPAGHEDMMSTLRRFERILGGSPGEPRPRPRP